MTDIRARRITIAALATAVALLWSANGAARQGASAPSTTDTFASRVASLSEPGGFFDTDNLISNERSYLHIVPELRAIAGQASRGGVYLGVGPDQGFSYIAHLRPALAIVIDIRRDNLLLHLLFKSIFEEARTRVDYLAVLTGRPVPAVAADWAQKPVDAIVAYIDGAPRLSADRVDALRARLTQKVVAYGVPLTDGDRATIDRFHRRFIEAGLSLQFNTTGRAPQMGYPTYRDLLLEVDRAGVRRSFVASEDDFQFLKGLQAKHLVVPIVGDLAGSTALAAVARHLTATHQQLAAFYTSNVEYYLYREGTFDRFMANVRALPHQPGSLMIRSVFIGGGVTVMPAPGYNSTQLTQPIQELVDGYAKGQFRTYRDLIAR